MEAKLELVPSSGPISLTLPVPPSVNALFRNAAKGSKRGRLKTRDYRLWIKDATFAVKKQVKQKIEGKYFIHLLYPRSSKADIWNLEKAVSDLLQKLGVIKNDRLCEGGSIYWQDGDEVSVSLVAA